MLDCGYFQDELAENGLAKGGKILGGDDKGAGSADDAVS